MMRICEAIRDVCRELENAKHRDPIWYHEAFGQRAKAAEEAGDVDAADSYRVLAAVFSICFKRGPDGPFGPLIAWPDGRRSFLPKDLKPEEAGELRKLIDCASAPVFVARIADVLWIATRNHEHARRAFRAYLESARSEADSWVLRRDALERAADLAMALGKKAPERAEVAAEVEKLFETSKVDCFTPERGHWPAGLAEILIDKRLASDWEKLGDECMAIARGFPILPGCDEPRRYYELAAHAYGIGGLVAKAKEARLAIAQHWEAEAGAFKLAGGDPFQISHRLEQAIHAYRKVGGEQGRGQVLMRDLKQANEKMLSEMKSVGVPIDVTPLVKEAERMMAGKAGMAALESFAALYEPAPYEDIRQEALSQSQASPLIALIGAKMVTAEGNVAANVPGITEDETAKIQAMVVQGYATRQNIVGATTLEVARRMIGEGPDESWRSAVGELVHRSHFVPDDRRGIFERALIAGFAGDRVVFAHLAIPQIENSVRVVFRNAGLPITTMNAEGVQEERDLNRLLTDRDAKTVLGEAMVWEMRSVLIEKSGPNLRNRLCHGLLGADEFDRPAMNVLLWLTASLLRAYGSTGGEQGPEHRG
jgi:hypothetical protein